MSPAIEHFRPLSVRVSASPAKSSPSEFLRERSLYVSTTAPSQDRCERESSGQRERAQRNPGQRHRRGREPYAVDRDP